nr:proline-rich receptor-like protein kinase PERK1 [Aegilops tauschii subsp. strangulata]
MAPRRCSAAFLHFKKALRRDEADVHADAMHADAGVIECRHNQGAERRVLPVLCVKGDFNEAIWQFEHFSLTRGAESQMEAFREALDDCALTDLGFRGVPFTYDNKHAGRKNLPRTTPRTPPPHSPPPPAAAHSTPASPPAVSTRRCPGLPRPRCAAPASPDPTAVPASPRPRAGRGSCRPARPALPSPADPALPSPAVPASTGPPPPPLLARCTGRPCLTVPGRPCLTVRGRPGFVVFHLPGAFVVWVWSVIMLLLDYFLYSGG